MEYNKLLENNGPTGLVYGAVNEPVTVLWIKPGQQRDHDSLILKKPVNPTAWFNGMDTEMRLWLVGKAATQAIYGEPLIILKRQGNWLKVVAINQRSALIRYGYPGWVPAAHIVTNQTYLTDLKDLPGAVITKPLVKLYQNKDLTGASVELCYQTRLPILEEYKETVTVRVPDGNIGYLPRDDVKKSTELTFCRDVIIEEAKHFLGVRYTWAGTSSYGFDCSGFVMRLYQSQGVFLPRDANDQAKEGVRVARNELLPGDLLFFAAGGGQDQIHHVGMYTGDGIMIHSPNSNSTVRLDEIDSGTYYREYWGAKRYVL
ncbi:MAG: C40 family peptidase [Desulfotomaculaceae bacterium]|nr:C40 family peptidase [Desulfotomaculaceae bacterium]